MQDKVKEMIGKLKLCAMENVGQGRVELVDINDGVVRIKLIGNCGACGCPCQVAQFATKMYIEKKLKREIPEVKRVDATFLTVES